MILDRIRLVGLDTIDLPIIFALPDNKYIIKAADGLGPPEVDVFIGNTLQQGGVYQGRRPQSREIVLRIGLNPDYGANENASDLRNNLYGLLAPNVTDDIKVQLMSNSYTVDMEAVGYVKRIEIVPFSKDPEVQVVVTCPQPYLQAPWESAISPTTKDNVVIANPGSAPTGFEFGVLFSASLSSWTIRHGEILIGPPYMSIQHPFTSGDILEIGTQPGNRYLTVRRSTGAITNIIDKLSEGSSWLMLHGGDNLFTVTSTAYQWQHFRYQARFWGV